MGRYDFDFGYNQAGIEPPKKNDVPTYQTDAVSESCMGAVTCVRCGRRHGYCSEVTEQLTGIKDNSGNIYTNPGMDSEEWNNQMIHRGSSSNDSGSGGGKGKRKNSGYTYLSADNLSTERQTATILDARTQEDNFKKGQEVVVVKIKFKGEIKLWTLRDGNPNLDVLCDSISEDETQWKGREVELFNEVDGFDGKKWIRLEVIPLAESKRKK